MKKRIVMVMLAGVLATGVMAGCGNSDDTKTANKSEKNERISYDEDYDSENVRLMGYANSDKSKASETYEYDDYSEMEEFIAYEDVQNEMESNAPAAPDNMNDAGNGNNNNNANAVLEDKIVYEANLSVETLDFDETYKQLTEMVAKCNGRIESEQYDANSTSYTHKQRNKNGYHTTKTDYIVIRVPADKYKEFMASDEVLGNVIEKTQTQTNISDRYYSTETRIELLEGQLDYYKHQLELVEEKLMECEDYEYVIGQMIDLEDRIISVQDQINNLKGNVATMDSQVAYSTVYLTLTEVKEYTEIITPKDEKEEKKDTFKTRFMDNLKEAWDSFSGVLEAILFGIIFVLPYLAIAAIITIVTVLKVKSSKKKRAKSVINAKATGDVSKNLVNATTSNVTTPNDEKSK